MGTDVKLQEVFEGDHLPAELSLHEEGKVEEVLPLLSHLLEDRIVFYLLFSFIHGAHCTTKSVK